MTYVFFELPGNFDRDPKEHHVVIPGTGWEFGALMTAARELFPDTRYRFLESHERP